MKRSTRTRLSQSVAVAVFSLLLSAASAAKEDESMFGEGRSALRAQHSNTRPDIVRRRLDEPGFESKTEADIGDAFMFVALAVLILALAFPAMSLTLFKTCPRLCCGFGQPQPADTPPTEIGSVEEAGGDYQFVTDVSNVSSTSRLSSGRIA